MPRAFRNLAIGLTAMYFLDPRLGRTRRAQLRDKVRSFGNDLAWDFDKAKRDLFNRSRGLFAGLSQRLGGGGADDRVLHDRVRAELGRHSTHAGAIAVFASGGSITLCGPILRDEVDGLVAAVQCVRGVQRVDNQLEVHDEPGNLPALQGQPRSTTDASSQWTPATRLVATGGGAVALIRGVLGRGPMSTAWSLAGLALMTRGVTNCPIGGLFKQGVESLQESGIGGTGKQAADPVRTRRQEKAPLEEPVRSDFGSAEEWQ